jgi:hypothetical protein
VRKIYFVDNTVHRLVPPSLRIGTEINFSPGAKDNLATFVSITVGKCQWKWCGSTHNGTGRRVLGTVARAHELVVGGRPRNDTSQVGADCDFQEKK